MTISITTIDLLRHGECVDGHCYRGSTNVALSERGWQQMQHSLGQTNAEWHCIVSSTLMRCADFAEQLSTKLKKPLIKKNTFKEMHFGDWEGQPINTIANQQPEAVAAWIKDPIAATPPAGEPMSVFAARVIKGLSDIIQHHSGEHVLLVSHGGVMRVLLNYCLAMPLAELNRFDIPYACVSRIQVVTDKGKHYYRLLTHNMTSPLHEK